METLVILLHIVTACAVVAFVLLQQGKGAEAGASFGAGASQTLFGSTGSWNFFSRVTAWLALIFFLTSFGLAVIAKHDAGAGVALTPELEMLDAAASADVEVPSVESGAASAANAEIPAATEAVITDGKAPAGTSAASAEDEKNVAPRDVPSKP